MQESGIKSVWVSEYNGIMKICMRMFTSKSNTGSPTIVLNSSEMPPLNSKTNVSDAKKEGTQEDHHIIGSFLYDDLVKIRDAINKKLVEIDSIQHVSNQK